jgi:hypothetical protein
MGRRTGCVVGLMAVVPLALVCFLALWPYLREQEGPVPRILWVLLQGIAVLPDPLEAPALGIFALCFGFGGGFVIFAGIARLPGRPL